MHKKRIKDKKHWVEDQLRCEFVDNMLQIKSGIYNN
jgi:hypothetical protein